MFNPQKILVEYARFTDNAARCKIDPSGKETGLSNTNKQLFGQSGMTGQAKVRIGDKTYHCILSNWTPARIGHGYKGETVKPNGGGVGDAKKKYYAGFKNAKMGILESAYLISWLGLSILNGRPPTSGAANIETSLKSLALDKILDNFNKDIEIIEITYEGAKVGTKDKGYYQLPTNLKTGDEIKNILPHYSTTAKHILELYTPTNRGSGDTIAKDDDSWLNL